MAIFSYDITKDNPGAYAFMKEACKIDFDFAEKVFIRMENLGIVGQMLYILWSDCFNCDTERALRVLFADSPASLMYHLNDAHKIIENRGIPYGEE